MPCSDVTERVVIRLNADELLTDYHVNKKTCGRAVGAESLLLDHLHGRSLSEVLDLDPAVYLTSLAEDGAFDVQDDVVWFLHVKHLLAIQHTLAAYTGREGSTLEDRCTMAGVIYDHQGVEIDADLHLDMSARKIKPCRTAYASDDAGGGCGTGCGCVAR